MKGILAVIFASVMLAEAELPAQSQTPSSQAVASGATQTSAAAKAKIPPDAEAPESLALPIPVVKLDFKVQSTISGAASSPAFVEPILCSPDGIPFVEFLQPPDFRERTIYSLDPKGGHAFSLQSIPGLYDVQLQSYFVGDSIVGLHVRATKDDKKSNPTYAPIAGVTPKPFYSGKHYDYIVEFDRDGNYKKTVELPEEYHFLRVAILADDSVLALGYDRMDSIARLLLLDSGGKILRELQIPQKMEDSPDLVQGQSGGFVQQVQAETSLSWWLFAPVRQRILLYQAHSNAPLLEVGSGGAVREVPLESPKGYNIDGIVASNDRWIIRFRKESLSANSGAIDARTESKNFVLYEVNPSDGSLRRQIEIGTGQMYSTTCEQDGVLSAFSMDGDKITRATADLQR